jgi:hypothetical protein
MGIGPMAVLHPESPGEERERERERGREIRHKREAETGRE